MKTTIENLEFPCEFKKKLKMKVSTTNLNMQFLSGHLIKFNQTNLSVREPHRIIISNSRQTLIALIYDDIEKIYLPSENAIVSFTKFVNCLNVMNKMC